MSNYVLQSDGEPSYDFVGESWRYVEIKRYFDQLVKHDSVESATKRFLSNVEGLGDFFDRHAFFDFQAYLVLNTYWYEKCNKALNFLTPEYENFSRNLAMLISGALDGWCDKTDIMEMKSDAEVLKKIYYLED